MNPAVHQAATTAKPVNLEINLDLDQGASARDRILHKINRMIDHYGGMVKHNDGSKIVAQFDNGEQAELAYQGLQLLHSIGRHMAGREITTAESIRSGSFRLRIVRGK